MSKTRRRRKKRRRKRKKKRRRKRKRRIRIKSSFYNTIKLHVHMYIVHKAHLVFLQL